MLDAAEYFNSSEEGEAVDASSGHFNYGFFRSPSSSSSSNKKNRKLINNKMRRFSEQQIRSLETIFESDSKLEPRKKLELAKDLGLQPRQVAIWFQNKRARRKSKQLEKDYNILRANYDSLSSQFDLLKRENQSLVFQLRKLHDLMDKNGEAAAAGTGHSTGENSGNTNHSDQVMVSALTFGGRSEKGLRGAVSDDDSRNRAAEEYLMRQVVEEEDEHHYKLQLAAVDMEEQSGDGCLAMLSPNNNLLDLDLDLESTPLLDQPCIIDCYNQWWDFWE